MEFLLKIVKKDSEDPYTKCWEVIVSGDNVSDFKKVVEANPQVINHKNQRGDSLLHQATLYARTGIIEHLISCGADINATDQYGDTPLFWALQYTPPSKRLECVVLLVKQGANIELGEQTPLWLASCYGYFPIVELLVEKGADTSALVNYSGKKFTPKEVALEKGHTDIALFLQFVECVHAIRKGDNLATVKRLVEQQPQILGKRDHNSYTLLHHAAWNGRTSILEHLIAESDANAVNNSNETPLYCGVAEGHTECVQVLVKVTVGGFSSWQRTDLELADKDGCTPLWKAALCGSLPMVELLAAAGANVASKGTFWEDGKSYTPRAIAQLKGHQQVADFLQNAELHYIPKESIPGPLQLPKSLPPPLPTVVAPRDAVPESPRGQPEQPLSTQSQPTPLSNPAQIEQAPAFRLDLSGTIRRSSLPSDVMAPTPSQAPPQLARHQSDYAIPYDFKGANSPPSTSPVADQLKAQGSPEQLSRNNSAPSMQGAHKIPVPQLARQGSSNAILASPRMAIQEVPPADDFPDPRAHAVPQLSLPLQAQQGQQGLSPRPPSKEDDFPDPRAQMVGLLQSTIHDSPVVHARNQEAVFPDPRSAPVSPREYPSHLIHSMSAPAHQFTEDLITMSPPPIKTKATSVDELLVHPIPVMQPAFRRSKEDLVSPPTQASPPKVSVRSSLEAPAQQASPPKVSMRSSLEAPQPSHPAPSVVEIPLERPQTPEKLYDSRGTAAKARELHTVVQPRFLPNIIPGDSVGKGQFGEVFKGIMDGTEVALKKLYRPNVSNEQWVLHLALETRHWVQLRHPNVVAFLGLYHDNCDSYYLCTEFIPLRSLSGFLRNPFYVSMLDSHTLVKMAISAVQGMIYLGDNQIVHGNLAARNLMVSQESEHSFSLKVDDFGLAHDVSSDYFRSSELAPFKWTAPEVFKTHRCTFQSDLWSFGVVLWEMFEPGKVPYQDLSYQGTIDFLEKGFRLAVPENAPPTVQQIIAECWRVTPEKRPAFAEILNRLQSFTEPVRLQSGSMLTADQIHQRH